MLILTEWRVVEMTFTTSEKIDQWVRKHSEECKTKAFDGAQFAYRFVPTGIIECQTVSCMLCNQEYTDYVD